MWNYKPGEYVTSQLVPHRILKVEKIFHLKMTGLAIGAESALCTWEENGMRFKRKLFLKDLRRFPEVL
jgi:hypothetical protein